MKHIILLFILGALLSSCAKYTNITVTAPTISSGVLVIKDANDSTIVSENILNGKLNIKQQALEYNGYYTLVITDKPQNGHKGKFDIYLEPGDYQITAADSAARVYPKIISKSQIQNELSAYYAILNALAAKLVGTYKHYHAVYNSNQTAKLSANQYKLLADQYNQATSNISENALETKAFVEFLNKFPESLAAAHIFAGLQYEGDPMNSFALFKKMSPAAQNTADGKQIIEKLQKLLRLTPGAIAPDVEGVTQDNKPFDKDNLDKKIYLVDFWKTGCEECRANHAQIINILNQVDKSKFGIISISLDKRRDWWMSSISEDHMDWPQYCDLKGNDSPNADHWNISQIPRYCLVDKNWHIIEPDIYLNEVELAVNEYLKKH